MTDLQYGDYSFDDLVLLAKEDPEQFEKVRQEILEAEITKRSDDPEKQQRMRAMIFNQDQHLNKIKNPIARFNKVQEQMWSQVRKFQDSLKGDIPTTKEENNIILLKTKEIKNENE